MVSNWLILPFIFVRSIQYSLIRQLPCIYSGQRLSGHLSKEATWVRRPPLIDLELTVMKTSGIKWTCCPSCVCKCPCTCYDSHEGWWCNVCSCFSWVTLSDWSQKTSGSEEEETLLVRLTSSSKVKRTPRSKMKAVKPSSSSEEEAPWVKPARARSDTTPQSKRKLVIPTSGSEDKTPRAKRKTRTLRSGSEEETPQTRKKIAEPSSGSEEFRTPPSTKRRRGRPASGRDACTTPRSAKRRPVKLPPRCSMSVLCSWYRETSEASGELSIALCAKYSEKKGEREWVSWLTSCVGGRCLA